MIESKIFFKIVSTRSLQWTILNPDHALANTNQTSLS